MKRALYLCLLLFLISCTSTLLPTTPIEAFNTSERCPHVCWLGINPGVTSAEEAHRILRASDQIDQGIFHASADAINTRWFLEKRKNNYSEVSVGIIAGRVESITFLLLAPLTMNDFVSLLGEPDEISIRVDRPADAEYVSYMIYYNKKKAEIWVLVGSNSGPQPTDNNIGLLVLSTEIKTLSPSWLADYDNYRQPWLGYGHFKDYLPGESTPVSNHPTP